MSKQCKGKKALGLIADDAGFIADLDQDPSARPRLLTTNKYSAKLLFTCISHGAIFNSDFGRILLSLEALIAHGVPATYELQADLDMEFPVDFFQLMQNGVVKPSQIFSMVGNGWHLPSVRSWFAWVLAHLEMRAPHQTVCRTPSNQGSDDEGDSDNAPLQSAVKRTRFEGLRYTTSVPIELD